MIRNYQMRFIRIMMISLTLILVIVLSMINILNIVQMYQQVNQKITFLIEHDGKLPRPDEVKKEPNNMFFETRFFTALIDGDQIAGINTSHVSSVSSSLAENYTDTVLERNQPKGFIADYYYQVSEKDNKKMIVFVNIHNQLDALQSFFVSSIWIGLSSLLILFVIIFLASKRAILPLVKNVEKQKRFITDAGHEIKTPLAIISANNEVLEMEIGENEWIKSSQKQIARLNELVKKMLMLSKMEEDRVLEFMDINISECLENSLVEFKPLFDQNKITLKKEIQNDVIQKADASSIQTLINILLENAVKYTSEPFEVSVKCYQHNKKTVLEVFNTCEAIEVDTNLFFERFYRADEARSSLVSGQGIGLSIAKAITDAHHGKISVQKMKNGILFKVEI